MSTAPHTNPALRQLLEAVAITPSPETVCEAALQYLEDQHGVTRSVIVLLGRYGGGRVTAHRGLSDAFIAGLEASIAESPAADHDPFVVADVEIDPEAAWRLEALRAEGIRSLAVAPMRIADRVIGRLVLYSDHVETRPEERGALGCQLANRFAIAIHRQQALAEHAELNSLFTTLLDHLPEAVGFVSPAGELRYVNASMAALYGVTPAELVAAGSDALLRAHRERFVDPTSQQEPWHRELDTDAPTMREQRHRDGRVFERHRVPVGPPGERLGHLVVVREITARRRVEGQLLHMHKMESVARLAGGIAHDFNNMLTAMIGYMDLVSASLPEASEERQWLGLALDAAMQASDLTRQLLTFARRQPMQPTLQDLNALLDRLLPLVRRMLPESIAIQMRLAARRSGVLADVGQLEQVIVNLAFNARDAMPAGGRLVLATADVTPAGDGARPMVALEISDTGVGMDEDALQHVFEPFYTTKADRTGAGMGLATVYGVVQQFGGTVEATSVPGEGTCFRVLLPLVEAPVAGDAAPAEAPPGGSETVLLVEDDASVRGLVGAMLGRAGYVVLAEERAEAALERLAGHPGVVHLLIADMVMPGMSGRDLAVRAQAARPGLRVLLTSGWSVGSPEGGPGARFAFLPKPFASDVLARQVRAVLDAPAAGA